MFTKRNLLLYAVTDRAWLNGRTLGACVEDALKAGVTMVQLREKDISYDEFLALAVDIKKICSKHGAPFIVNDNIDVAAACGADGVHLGQSDGGAREARAKLARGKIVGVSVQTLAQALDAEMAGADYLGVGAVFPTVTKQDAAEVDFKALKQICSAVQIPVVAIGGINALNIKELKNSGICGAAIVSAIFAQKDIFTQTQKLKKLCEAAFL